VSVNLLQVFAEHATLSFQLICARRSIFRRGVKSWISFIYKNYLLKYSIKYTEKNLREVIILMVHKISFFLLYTKKI